MKILFLSEFFPVTEKGEISGGAESRTYYLSTEFAKRGHKIFILSSNTAGPKRGHIQTGSFWHRFLFFLDIIKQGLKTDFDLVDANSVPTYLAAWLLAKVKGKKSVFWIPDIVGFSAAIRHLGFVSGVLEAGFELVSIRFIIPDATIALSHTTKLKIGRGEVVYPGVEEIVPSKKSTTLISVNRLYQYKRTDLVVRAASRLKVRCQIIGTGPEENNLKFAGKNISFLGNLPHREVLKKLAGAKVFVLASEVEGFGIVTLEAMAAGIPFVNSDIPVHQEIVAASQAGLLFKTGNTTDLVVKLKQLLSNKILYQKLSSNARAFAKKYSLAREASKTEKIYEHLLSH